MAKIESTVKNTCKAIDNVRLFLISRLGGGLSHNTRRRGEFLRSSGALLAQNGSGIRFRLGFEASQPDPNHVGAGSHARYQYNGDCCGPCKRPQPSSALAFPVVNHLRSIDGILNILWRNRRHGQASEVSEIRASEARCRSAAGLAADFASRSASGTFAL